MTKEQIQEFTRRTTQGNHSEFILILTDVTVIYINDALEMFDKSDIDGFRRNTELAKRSLNELIKCFSPNDGQGSEVIKLLRFIYRGLAASLAKRVPVDMDTAMDILNKLRPAFVKLHEIDTDGPVMKNTHQVYAGLTYGKGVLNESIQGVNVRSRGFSV